MANHEPVIYLGSIKDMPRLPLLLAAINDALHVRLFYNGITAAPPPSPDPENRPTRAPGHLLSGSKSRPDHGPVHQDEAREPRKADLSQTYTTSASYSPFPSSSPYQPLRPPRPPEQQQECCFRSRRWQLPTDWQDCCSLSPPPTARSPV